MAWTKSNLKRSYACNAELLAFLRERKGWTQQKLADSSGYSKRLICKAEAGESISVDAIDDLAEALSSPEDRVYPEDLISDPVKMAQDYIAGLYLHQKDIVNAIRHFLDDDVVIRLPGDPDLIPFAGTHRGISEVERVFGIFFSILEAPANHDHKQYYSYLGQGNEVMVWGESWIHPIGAPMTEPMRLVHRMKCRRGKLILVDVVYDSLHGKRVLEGEEHMNSAIPIVNGPVLEETKEQNACQDVGQNER